MDKEIIINNPSKAEIDRAEDAMAFMRAGLDPDDAENLAYNLTPEEREAAKYVYSQKPPITPPPADIELRRLSSAYRAMTGIRSLDIQGNSMDSFIGRPRV